MSVAVAIQRRLGHAELSGDDTERPPGLDRRVDRRTVWMSADSTDPSHADSASVRRFLPTMIDPDDDP